MPSIFIELASPSDDADLLRLMADMPMPGPIRVAYQREPSYFDALTVEGSFNQVLVGRDAVSGEVVGICNRSVKKVYVNGKEAPAGYISGLRLLPQYRGSRALAQGYAFLKELHKDNRTNFYLASVIRRNKTADLISKRRGKFPSWEKIASFRNMAITLKQKAHHQAPSGISIRNALPSDAKQIIAFLNAESRKRQFYPVYSEDDICSDNGLLKNLNPGDICLAYSQGALCGVAAGWDQQSFRPSVIRGYNGLLSLVRPFYNIGAPFFSKPRLPAVHSTLNYFFLSLVCIRGDDTSVFSGLLDYLMRQRAHDYEFMMAGMCEGDPLLSCLSRYRHINYPADLFRISLDPCNGDGTDEDDLIPYLEIGAL